MLYIEMSAIWETGQFALLIKLKRLECKTESLAIK